MSLRKICRSEYFFEYILFTFIIQYNTSMTNWSLKFSLLESQHFILNVLLRNGFLFVVRYNHILLNIHFTKKKLQKLNSKCSRTFRSGWSIKLKRKSCKKCKASIFSTEFCNTKKHDLYPFHIFSSIHSVIHSFIHPNNQTTNHFHSFIKCI